jgi:Fe-S oxidoreductase
VALGEGGGKEKYLNEMDKVLKCTNCGYCIETCKYHLPVPDLMRNARRTYYEIVKTYGV